jgi:hypothetical protein
MLWIDGGDTSIGRIGRFFGVTKGLTALDLQRNGMVNEWRKSRKSRGETKRIGTLGAGGSEAADGDFAGGGSFPLCSCGKWNLNTDRHAGMFKYSIHERPS